MESVSFILIFCGGFLQNGACEVIFVNFVALLISLAAAGIPVYSSYNYLYLFASNPAYLTQEFVLLISMWFMGLTSAILSLLSMCAGCLPVGSQEMDEVRFFYFFILLKMVCGDTSTRGRFTWLTFDRDFKEKGRLVVHIKDSMCTEKFQHTTHGTQIEYNFTEVLINAKKILNKASRLAPSSKVCCVASIVFLLVKIIS